ncbi:hypothetical protein [Nocardioides sp. 503]|uniref:hypothetical protein n=1 Tax=Nocardioides sp. 503 TaxID=2508326 RepID=UPI00106F484B|nr:hypothetical protein [Nocardioides sp. 503]
MTLDRLREELARLGDTAPVAQVDHDTWQRAGRARRRDRLVVAGSVLAVALLAGALTWLPDRVDPPVADGAGGAVPDQVWAVPERLAERSEDDGSWVSDEVETDLAIGTGALAFEKDGLPVVVDADDGDYHLLELPGFFELQADSPSSSTGDDAPLSLSPDGRRLAYAWVRFETDSPQAAVASGVRVVELQTGTVREIPLPSNGGVAVGGFDWSPSGDWLAWVGDDVSGWTGESSGGTTPVAGLIGPVADTSQPLPVLPNNASVSYAPADDGTVAIVGDSRMLVVDGPSVERRVLHVGERFSVGATFVGGELYDVRTAGGTRGYSVHLDPTRERLDLPDQGMASQTVEPLGWIDDRHLVARVTEPSDEEGEVSASELAVIGVGDDPSYDVVGTIEADVPPISVATDLMSLEQPTVERPEPDWPWSSTRVALTIGLVLAAAMLAYATTTWWRRRAGGRRGTTGDAPGERRTSRSLLLVGGTVLGAAATVVWLLAVPGIAGDSASNDDSSAVLLTGVACIVGLGTIAMAVRRWRWLGAGLILGAVGAVVVLLMLLVTTVG